MVDFSQLSPEQILIYVSDNSKLFARKFDDGFPANVASGLAGSLWATIRRMEGFAIVFKGINPLFGNDGKNADLMFLHVLPAFEGRGIGKQIVEEAMAAVPAGRPIDVTCEGERRMRFFERCGFAVQDHDTEEDLYYMQWAPSNQRNNYSKNTDSEKCD